MKIKPVTSNCADTNTYALLNTHRDHSKGPKSPNTALRNSRLLFQYNYECKVCSSFSFRILEKFYIYLTSIANLNNVSMYIFYLKKCDF